jgi:hypothetical protein
MITLGRWDEFVARPFVRASTTFHELGHNFNLWHGGAPAVVGNKALNLATRIEPNCKPDYLSSMSYLYQIHGLFDDSDDVHLDFSGTDQDDITEATAPGDAPLNPASTYRPAWYAPAGSTLASDQGAPAAKAFCNGVKFDPLAPAPPSMARVVADLSGDAIDWNGDNVTNSANPLQDVNFRRRPLDYLSRIR